jgi:hypothetical protein
LVNGYEYQPPLHLQFLADEIRFGFDQAAAARVRALKRLSRRSWLGGEAFATRYHNEFGADLGYIATAGLCKEW